MKYSLLGACVAACCCTAPVFAQGLTRVETLALQQQLRDDGCGTTHITGRVDATTRADVKKCETKYSGASTPTAMLTAMNIGFGNGITAPTLASARGETAGSMSAGGTSAGAMHENMDRNMKRNMKRNMDRNMDRNMKRNMNRTMRDSTMMRDSAGRRHMMRDSTMMRRGAHMRDSTTLHHGSGMRDSMKTGHGTPGMSGSGGMVDTHKTSPMMPRANPTHPRDTSTMSH